jgi:hypothetical protein
MSETRCSVSSVEMERRTSPKPSSAVYGIRDHVTLTGVFRVVRAGRRLRADVAQMCDSVLNSHQRHNHRTGGAAQRGSSLFPFDFDLPLLDLDARGRT